MRGSVYAYFYVYEQSYKRAEYIVVQSPSAVQSYFRLKNSLLKLILHLRGTPYIIVLSSPCCILIENIRGENIKFVSCHQFV